MPTRRAVLGATGGLVATGMSGCLDKVPFVGGGPLEFEASPAIVTESALDASGYALHRRNEIVIERTFEAAGQRQAVVVTNHQTEYDRAVDVADLGLPIDRRLRAAVFTAVTTPKVEVLGQTFNPVGRMDPSDLVQMVQERYQGVDEVRQVGEGETAVAGQTAIVTEFEASAALADTGRDVDITMHISEAVELGADLLLAIAAYPRALRSQERDTVSSLMDAIEHESPTADTARSDSGAG